MKKSDQLDASIILLRERIEAGMRGSADLILNEFQIDGIGVLTFMFDGLVSNSAVSDFLLRPLYRMEPGAGTPEKLWHYLKDQCLLSSEQGEVETYSDLFTKAMSGFAMVMVDGVPRALSLGYQGFETRGVSEPAAEKNMRGSREGFTESNNTNTALVRRRLKSPYLTVETLYLGRQSRTNVRMLYLSDVADAGTVDLIRQKISRADMPVVLDTGYLQPFIGKGTASLFSGAGVTQRPDTLCAKLAEGRIGIMVDGSPCVMVAPYLFMEHFQSLDDYTQRPYFATFVRLLKLAAFFLTVFLPGYYVAIVSYHPELIPRTLLRSFLGSVVATPMSAMGEALVLFLLYELLREAGLRLPDAIGHTLSVVGGIVIGDAIVTAGLVGLPMIIIIALTAVSAFVVPSLYEPITILRFLFIFVGGILGVYGIFLGFLLLTVNLCALQSLSTPITSPLAPWEPAALRDLFWRAGWEKLKKGNYRISSAAQTERRPSHGENS